MIFKWTPGFEGLTFLTISKKTVREQVTILLGIASGHQSNHTLWLNVG